MSFLKKHKILTIIFSLILVIAGVIFWQIKSRGIASLLWFAKPMVKISPVEKETKEQLLNILDITTNIAPKEEKTFLLLFQNNHELRPGGGYIGSFGILKIHKSKVVYIDVHDTNVFDDRASTNIPAPFPMQQMLNIKDWELRDSNWSPDFPTNAKKAEEFYHMEGGGEKIDGVAAISTDILEVFLKVVGPVSVAPAGEFTSENVINKLQAQVEQEYWKQGIEKPNRKDIMKDLAKEILKKAQDLSWEKKKELLGEIEHQFQNKNVMVYFKEQKLQESIERLGWEGKVKNTPPSQDFLMIVDANLAALKSDRYIKRSFVYEVDLTKEKPRAHLEITYQHTAKQKDHFTKAYDSFFRVYAPAGSWLQSSDGTGESQFGQELGKKYFGFLTHVDLDSTKLVTLDYDLPETIDRENYSLLIQKQSGVDTVPGKVVVTKKTGQKEEFIIALEKEVLIEVKMGQL